MTALARNLCGRSVAVIVLAVLVSLAAGVITVLMGIAEAGISVMCLGFIAAGEVFRLRTSGGRQLAPVSQAVALGYAVLLPAHTLAADLAAQVIAVTAAGVLAGAMPYLAVGRSMDIPATAARLLAVAIAAVGFNALIRYGPAAAWWTATSAASCVVISLASGLALSAAADAQPGRTRPSAIFAGQLRALGPVSIATAASAMMIAVSMGTLGVVGLLAGVVPAAAAQVAFRRATSARAAITNALGSLTHALEIGGYVAPGHPRRVARLAVAAGSRMGMSEHDLLDLEHAALIHDIGQFSLPRPLPGGMTSLAAPDEQACIARYGAEMIRRAGTMDQIAQIISHQHEPFQPQGRPQPATLAVPRSWSPPLASRLIKAASTYDDMAGDTDDPDHRAAVLELLRLDAPDSYDPDVIDAIEHILNARERQQI